MRTSAFRRGLLLAALGLGGVLSGCRDRPRAGESGAVPSASSAATSRPESGAAPRELYLPDAGDQVQNRGNLALEAPLPPAALAFGACPSEMVRIRAGLCIDRYEGSLVDAQARRISPYYPADSEQVLRVWNAFRSPAPRGPPVPLPPEFELTSKFVPLVRSEPQVVPNGYLSGIVARRACEASGKRLCTPDEWRLACRGTRQTKFPYGPSFEEGRCNVFREAHPANVLHGDASKHHLDPRLNQVEGQAGPLLRRTGETTSCRSEWGSDAVYDMVGNLDEWVDSPGGMFLGGFFSRGTREGCDAQISSHPPDYFDYSLGVRCCKAP